jgi:hypothetical protein
MRAEVTAAAGTVGAMVVVVTAVATLRTVVILVAWDIDTAVMWDAAATLSEAIIAAHPMRLIRSIIRTTYTTAIITGR